jgi:hypothetical protein
LRCVTDRSRCRGGLVHRDILLEGIGGALATCNSCSNVIMKCRASKYNGRLAFDNGIAGSELCATLKNTANGTEGAVTHLFDLKKLFIAHKIPTASMKWRQRGKRRQWPHFVMFRRSGSCTRCMFCSLQNVTYLSMRIKWRHNVIRRG